VRAADLIRLSFGAILAHRLRSALTVLGILVGITAVVLLTSIGEGVRVFVLAEFTQFGTHIMAVVPGKVNTFGASGATISTVRPLSLEDADALGRLEGIEAVVPVIQGNAAVEYGARARRTMLLGVGPAVPELWTVDVAIGRFLPEDDYRAARPFAVLGAKMREELFGAANPLGERVRIGGESYRIVGVMESKGQMLGFDMDDTVFIPIAKSIEMFDRQSVMEIDLRYSETVAVESIEREVKRLMIARHGSEDFTIITQNQMLEVLDKVLNVITMGVAAIGGISLIVGAVGILTIMTIAVTERTAEIGLLRALGARRAHVLRLFLGEALVLGAAGGLLGIGVAFGIGHLLGIVLPGLPVETAWRYIALALVLSTLIGLAAGIAPALRAAAMHPLDALRAE
jgi:putative ABC transport system permease protein